MRAAIRPTVPARSLARLVGAARGTVRAAAILLLAAAASAQSVYEKDVAFAATAIAEQCKVLIADKRLDWDGVAKEFGAAARKVGTDQEHLVLLTRMLARLNDGHCEVRPTAKTKDVRWPDEGELVGCGMFWCRSGKKILVKTVYGDAKALGILPGSEVQKVDGKPVGAWLDARILEMRDTRSCSTDQMAFYRATHQWLAMPKGTRLELELKAPDGGKQKRTITYTKGAYGPWGPAVPPEGLDGDGDVSFGRIDADTGYVQIRRCKDDLPQRIDQALAKVGSAKGLILDFRANSGGGFDHDEFLGRFVPQGEKLAFGHVYESRGPHPYAGPIVVIVDAGVVSAGETGAGIFKEDGRGYLIGESATAGMSSQKTTIALPSGLFELYVSTHSNKGRFNGSRGIEGIGIEPHEIVAYDAKDLAKGVDTLVRRATEILKDFPHAKVPYRAR